MCFRVPIEGGVDDQGFSVYCTSWGVAKSSVRMVVMGLYVY